MARRWGPRKSGLIFVLILIFLGCHTCLWGMRKSVLDPARFTFFVDGRMRQLRINPFREPGPMARVEPVAAQDTIPASCWKKWQSLVRAVAANEIQTVLDLMREHSWGDGDRAFMAEAIRVGKQHKFFDAILPILMRFYGSDVMYHAVSKGYLELVEKLLAAGCSVNQYSRGGETPLHTAVMVNCPAMITFLLARGADQALPDSLGNTAEFYAQGHPKILVAFQQHRSGEK